MYNGRVIILLVLALYIVGAVVYSMIIEDDPNVDSDKLLFLLSLTWPLLLFITLLKVIKRLIKEYLEDMI